jgi:hypothetical protein
MSYSHSEQAEQDVDLMIVTGAGASCAFGVNDTRLPLMADWSRDLVQRLGDRGLGFLSTTGLTRDMDGPEFEEQLGKFLRAVAAFKSIDMLLEPLTAFPLSNAPITATGQWLEWHRQSAHSLDEVTSVIHESLYGLFAAPRYDPGAAQQAYAGLFAELGVGRATRLVYATTNYDTIGEEMLAALGYMPDVGDFEPSPFQAERVIRVDRLLDGMPRYTPVMHLHGRIGWFRRQQGRAVSIPGQNYSANMGVPIVMLPDLEKDYASDPIINTLWVQFAEALRRATRVLVLGHSLHDEALVRTLNENLRPATRLGVTVLASRENPQLPDDGEPLALAERIPDLLPAAEVIPLRFDSSIPSRPETIRGWLAAAP